MRVDNTVKFKVNDEVEFTAFNHKFKCIVNFVSPNGLIRINSLVGEFQRKPHEIRKVNINEQRF